jgi:quercetin dioxygenase-like cupin family protein
MRGRTETNYTKMHRLEADVLGFLLDMEVDELEERAGRSSNGRASKTLVKEGRLRVTVVSLTAGSALEAHATEGPVSIHCLRGHIRINTPGKEMDMSPGGLTVLNTMVEHSVTALDAATFLLTLSLEQEEIVTPSGERE